MSPVLHTMPAATDSTLSVFLEHEVYPRLTAEMVYTHHEHRFQKNGVKMRGGCPWHDSNSGSSFVVNLESLVWYDAGCDIGGGPLQYLHRIDGGDGHLRGDEFVRYVRRVADLAGVSFPERELTPEEQERARANEARREILSIVNRLAVDRLWSDAGEAARAYLIARGGYGDDAIRSLGIGLYPERGDLQAALRDAGVARQDIIACGVLPKDGGLFDHIIVPWSDANGQPLTIYGRVVGTPPSGQSKTRALPGELSKRSPLFFDRARKDRHDELVLVEGLLDAVTAQAHGDSRVIACVAASLSYAQVETLKRYRVRSVTLCLDPDSAGENGVKSCIRCLAAAGIVPFVAPGLPDGMDPDEFIAAFGIDEWRDHVAVCVHGFRYEANRIIAAAIGDRWSDARRNNALKQARAYAGTFPDHADDLATFFWPVIEESLGVPAGTYASEARSDTTGSGNSAYSADSAYSDSSEEWPEPIRFHEAELPPFPVETLPDSLQWWVIAEAEATQTPPDLAAMLALTAVSACAARKVQVVPQSGWVEPVNISTVTVLDPGSRKSAVFADATSPIEDYEAEIAARAKVDIDAAVLKQRTLETELQKLIKKAASSEGDERLVAEADVQDVGAKLAKIIVPELPRLIVDDCTPERVASLLSSQGGKIAVMSPEGDVFDIMSGKYNSGAPNFGVYLKGHAGDSIRVDRVGRAPELIRRPAITMGLTIQPEVLQGLISRPGFRGRGLLGRFFYSIPENTVGHRKVRPKPMPEYVANNYDSLLRSILDLRLPTALDGSPVPYTLKLSTEAEAIFDAFVAELEPELGEFGSLAHIADWAGKLAGLVIRLAGIMHTAKHVEPGVQFPENIEAKTIENAITIGRYAVAHARAAFAEMGADPVVEDARYFLRWLTRGDELEQVTRRDLFNASRSRFKRVEDIDPAIRLLIAHNYLREALSQEREGPGRKPSPAYEINPGLYTQNTQNTQNRGPR